MGLDIRIPLGLIFLIIGGIMAVFGLVTHGDAALYARSLDIDINLAWGGIMVALRRDHVLRRQAEEVAGHSGRPAPMGER